LSSPSFGAPAIAMMTTHAAAERDARAAGQNRVANADTRHWQYQPACRAKDAKFHEIGRHDGNGFPLYAGGMELRDTLL